TGVTVRVDGLDRLDPARSYVFAANHQSIYDIPIVFASLPFQLRIIAKASLRRIPVMVWHLQRTVRVLVDRSRPGSSTVKKMALLVAEGHSLIVFPEGTRSRDGAVAPFKGGSFVIALDAKLPIVPLTIVGSRHVMRKGELMVRPGSVSLVVHDPIETAGGGRDRARDLAANTRGVVAAAGGEGQGHCHGIHGLHGTHGMQRGHGLHGTHGIQPGHGIHGIHGIRPAATEKRCGCGSYLSVVLSASASASVIFRSFV